MSPSPASSRAPSDLPRRLTDYAALIRAELAAELADSGPLAGFYGMMAYHMGWVDREFVAQPARAGKSLRPALCLLLCEGLGGDLREGVALAAGIELLHNFSLVHDDIEDRSPTRRGRPTVWSIWGEAQAINTGDGLFVLSHQVCLRSPLATRDPSAFVEILRSFEHTIVRLCEGQYLDIGAEGSLDVSSSAYLAMIGRKTAALIGEAAWIGARLATADTQVHTEARRFGDALGLAFQIRDDLLGIWGDESETGKSASSDIATRKMTLPVILALENGSPEVRHALRVRYGTPPAEPDDEAGVRALLAAGGARERAAAAEQEHWQAAMRALERLPLAADWSELLRTFAQSFVQRRA
jgi:geranylgeranyl diphosphate synthase, type I